MAITFNNIISVSELHNSDFGSNYGVRITDGPLAGLFARSVVILDEKGTVVYNQLVPDYEKELSVLR